MIFVDTSAFYALLDQTDDNHEVAVATWGELLDSGADLFTTSYVLVESCALAQNRLGIEAARTLHEDLLPALSIQWLDEAAHSVAMAVLLSAHRRRLSLVDCASFGAMRRAGCRVAFAFDKHFTEQGFAFPC